ncbi:hypothetical protein CVT25_001944 [Psilocybe cyanescens]|uniref:HAT C-terminal dimerisation domain-containing protein n=1 Tax=Psilocybe cyanescens TaxID=93625 RepID=A0A409WQQ5_PSICY|nr:hypothetical protein CVT25_001944 [Psilocybe cyanescens]
MLELDKNDWDAISQVASWLKAFHSATTQMSKTKEPMLSTVHAIFRGLQDHIRSILSQLPDSAPTQLRDGLLEAHNKLSEYYYKSYESPYYTWAASAFFFFLYLAVVFYYLLSYLVLNPRIMYEGLKSDSELDPTLLADLDKAKEKLKMFYCKNYASTSRLPPVRPSQSSSSVSSGNGGMLHSPEKINFTSCYQKKDRVVVNKLEEYLKLPREDFDTCKPLQWWLGRRSQFLRLYRLVCDVFSIPGSAVAVERIFSRGHDTISLRRASLVSDTIRVLMLVKHCLRLARIALEKKDRYK